LTIPFPEIENLLERKNPLPDGDKNDDPPLAIRISKNEAKPHLTLSMVNFAAFVLFAKLRGDFPLGPITSDPRVDSFSERLQRKGENSTLSSQETMLLKSNSTK